MSELLASVQALDHGGMPWRELRVHTGAVDGFVAERIESPGEDDEAVVSVTCAGPDELYAFFGNEPLANYLYGRLGAPVPGLRTVTPRAAPARTSGTVGP